MARFQHSFALVLLSPAGLLALAPPCAVAGEAFTTLETRPGVTQQFLLVRPDATPVASVVLFSGSEGIVRLTEGNFLVRNRQRFAAEGFLVAVVDVPSDHKTGYGWFRTSKEHAQDISAVIGALRREGPVPVWVVGTSMGAVSAANAAARLKDGGPDGVVLTSSVTRRSAAARSTVMDVDLDEIRVPTLVVHHESDGCVVTPFADAGMLTRLLMRAPKKELMTFRGGAPAGDPCGPFSAHGFMGIDSEVVTAIADWIKATP